MVTSADDEGDFFDTGFERRTKSPFHAPLPFCRGAAEASPSAQLSRALKPTRKYSVLLDAAAGQGSVFTGVERDGGRGGGWYYGGRVERAGTAVALGRHVVQHNAFIHQ